LPIVFQLLREIKKREPKYNELLLGPRKPVRFGIDVVERDIWRPRTPTTFFLSHSWGAPSYVDHERVMKIAEALKSRGHSVFLDSETMTGDLKMAMANGIDATKVFLVFISQSYVDKVKASSDNNCKYEWQAACNMSKKMFPILMDQNLASPSSWGVLLTAKLGGYMYANYVDDGQLDECVDTIMKELKESL